MPARHRQAQGQKLTRTVEESFGLILRQLEHERLRIMGFLDHGSHAQPAIAAACLGNPCHAQRPMPITALSAWSSEPLITLDASEARNKINWAIRSGR